MDEENPLVLIVMGSASDLASMKKCVKVFKDFEVPYEMTVASAHRSPERAMRIAREARARGVKVIIAAAGLAAHLAGAMAAHSTLPVIGVPMESGPLKGLDALLSTVQMPPGVPVATVAIGDVGARNAAHLAIRILALTDESLAEKLAWNVKEMAEMVEKTAFEIED